MEITWDEELGPEPNCPHCYNELAEYRTVTVKRDAALAFDEEDDDAWSRYTRAAEKYLDAQEDVPECPQCQEYMVFAGDQLIGEAHFAPRTPSPALPPFLRAPFRLETFVCAHCFTAHQRLAEKDKKALIARLAEADADE